MEGVMENLPPGKGKSMNQQSKMPAAAFCQIYPCVDAVHREVGGGDFEVVITHHVQ
ncbi:hypothetical protein TRIUR3_18798 [Triticum urartu]|uniref:Uncharacterized protein n=1 Tax=Triticum urartu TaxID=4572 RepID=M7ZIJ2_TRIUA|nr:hypothetical protein TRIUR3_18798 [Triticum urartu]